MTREDKREKIMRAALELFASTGFHGTNVPAIATHGKVSTGTIYRYFEHKEHLVNAIYQHWQTEVLERIQSQVPRSAPPRDQLGAYWRALTSMALDQPTAMVFLTLHHHTPYLDAASTALEGSLSAHANAIFAHMKDAGALKPLPTEAHLAIVHGILCGLITSAQKGLLALDQALFDDAEIVCWEALRR